MKNETKYKYGTDTIEFFTFDADELQDRIQMAEEVYYQSVARGEGQLCANIHFHESPFPIALKKLLALHDAGYTVNENKFCGLQGGAIDLTLTKPQSEIDRDLVQVHKRAEEQYHAHRYQLNSEETSRQIQITLDRTRREREAAEAATAIKADTDARQAALDDLKAVYGG
ncbi:hypothetical protein [Pseudomonas nitroreducens]|uniref:hypothetical protein n=1 Tax=Pseudomonas nitroreducens TaxID=46680 RepID=UPI001876DAA9|nr:hypothetical protein [Pseudomonas nitritireducens]